jgi:hypothetical protein
VIPGWLPRSMPSAAYGLRADRNRRGALPGDNRVGTAAALAFAAVGPVPLCLVTGWPLLKRPHIAVGVIEI